MDPSLEEKIKENVAMTMRALYLRGLVSAIAGNASGRVPGTDKLWITPSGVFKGSISPKDLVKIDFKGNVVEGRQAPSSEWRLHVAIYGERPEVYYVAHAHNPLTTTLTLAGVKLQPELLTETTLLIKGVAYVPRAPPGSSELAEMVRKAVQGNINVIVLEGHGVVVLGREAHEVVALAESVEELAAIQIWLSLLSAASKVLKDSG